MGVAWYREDQWPLLRRVAADAQRLERTYEEWLVSATRMLETLKRKGYSVERVDVDVNALVDWCHAQGRPVDGAARSEYAAARTRAHHVPH